VAAILRNGWPESIGIGGRLRPESAAGIERNMHMEKIDARKLSTDAQQQIRYQAIRLRKQGRKKIERVKA